MKKVEHDHRPSDLPPHCTSDEVTQGLCRSGIADLTAGAVCDITQRPVPGRPAARPRFQQLGQPPWCVATPPATTHDAHQHQLTQLPKALPPWTMLRCLKGKVTA